MSAVREPAVGVLPEVVERAMDRVAGSRPIPGNQVELLFDGPEIYPAMLERIAAARRWIHLDSYIIRSDATGRRFADALIERARAGVAVRVLTDWLGSLSTRRSYWRALREAGVAVRSFGSPSLLKLRRNLVRDHRKLLVVDGRTAVTGGHCIGDEWAGIPGKREPWRDTACAIDGPAAASIDQAFAQLWQKIKGTLEPEELAADVAACGDSAIRILAGEPGGMRASRATDLLLAGASERVWITDAYLVAPRAIYSGLLDAARGGMDIRLLVPGTSDLTHLQNLTRVGYRDLLEAGVRIFEWRGPMLHAKTMVADGRWTRIGSTNLNFSSLLANYELDVLIEDPGLGQAMEARFRRDIEQCVEIRYRDPRPGRSRRTLAAVAGESGGGPKRHRPGLRERRGRAVMAVWAVAAGARRTILLQYSVALAGMGILFLLFPRAMAWVFAVLALWLALSAWFETWGRDSS
ncbi:MAG TPA: phospholipase D-like domain-containing protein [Gemmatimonadales bacterium]|nr:phospholipase D-like domain-containing protein [Gemmatimonadales bacterium]